MSDKIILIKKEKKCYVCKKIKSVSEFYRNRANKDGLSTRCKICDKKKSKERFEGEEHQYLLTESRKRYMKIRQYVLNYKLSKGCAFCGYNKYAEALDFHHNGNKEFCIATKNTLSLKRLKKEMDKCMILCANCHRELHAKRKMMGVEQNEID